MGEKRREEEEVEEEEEEEEEEEAGTDAEQSIGSTDAETGAAGSDEAATSDETGADDEGGAGARLTGIVTTDGGPNGNGDAGSESDAEAAGG